MVGEAYREDIAAPQATLSYNPAAEQMELRLYLLGDSVADFLTVIEGQHQDITLVGVTNSFSIG